MFFPLPKLHAFSIATMTEKKNMCVIGWPFAFADSGFLANPIQYDLNNDGKEEILVTTKDGEMVFLGYVWNQTLSSILFNAPMLGLFLFLGVLQLEWHPIVQSHIESCSFGRAEELVFWTRRPRIRCFLFAELRQAQERQPKNHFIPF
jgi:hypothetical protein